MTTTCYVGCVPTTAHSTVAPHVPITAHLAYTGADLKGLLIAGIVALVWGVVFIIADRRIRKGKP